MKKISNLLFLFVLLFSVMNISAQQATETSKSKVKTEKKAPKQSPAAVPATKLKKDGTPDMRYKNKQSGSEKPAAPAVSKQPAVVTPAVKPAPVAKKAVVAAPAVKPAAAANAGDKVVGTDDKNRTIYEGPRGGRYYINKNGNKTYIKKDKLQ